MTRDVAYMREKRNAYYRALMEKKLKETDHFEDLGSGWGQMGSFSEE
jgi:hypothetical protein